MSAHPNVDRLISSVPRFSLATVVLLATLGCGNSASPPVKKSNTENGVVRPKIAVKPASDELAVAIKSTDGDIDEALKKIDAPAFRNSDRKIEWIDLSEKKVTIQGIQELAKLKGSLLRLTLNNTYLTDDGLKALIEQHPKLTKLQLNQTPVTDDGIESLKGLKDLRELELRATDIGDAGMSHIAELGELRLLSLSFTKVTPAGFSQLANLKEMRKLILQDTAADDSIFEALRKLDRLEYVDLIGTKVTEKGVKAFRNTRRAVTVRSAPKPAAAR